MEEIDWSTRIINEKHNFINKYGLEPKKLYVCIDIYSEIKSQSLTHNVLKFPETDEKVEFCHGLEIIKVGEKNHFNITI